MQAHPLTQLLRLPLELYSGKSLLVCFLYLLKIFSYANIGGVAGYSATVKGVATRKSLGTNGLHHVHKAGIKKFARETTHCSVNFMHCFFIYICKTCKRLLIFAFVLKTLRPNTNRLLGTA